MLTDRFGISWMLTYGLGAALVKGLRLGSITSTSLWRLCELAQGVVGLLGIVDTLGRLLAPVAFGDVCRLATESPRSPSMSVLHHSIRGASR